MAQGSPSNVLISLLPNVSFSIGNDLSSLVIHIESIAKPTQAEFDSKLAKLKNTCKLFYLKHSSSFIS